MSEFSERIAAARKAKRMSRAELGEATGYSEAAIARIEKGETISVGNMTGLADALGIQRKELVKLAVDAKIERKSADGRKVVIPAMLAENYKAATGADGRFPVRAGLRAAATRPAGLIPVQGMAAGSLRGHLIMSDTATDWVPCPPELAGIDGAYSVWIVGDSMRPMYRPGQRANIHPYREPRAEDGVLLQVRGKDGVEGYVKEFVRRTDTEIIVKQYNPEKTIKFKVEDVVKLHRVSDVVTL